MKTAAWKTPTQRKSNYRTFPTLRLKTRRVGRSAINKAPRETKPMEVNQRERRVHSKKSRETLEIIAKMFAVENKKLTVSSTVSHQISLTVGSVIPNVEIWSVIM